MKPDRCVTTDRGISWVLLLLGLKASVGPVFGDGVHLPERVLGLGSVRSIAFSPEGDGIVAGGVQAQWHDLGTGALRQSFVGHTNTVRAVAVSPSGSWVATGGEDSSVLLWDAPTAQIRWRLGGHARGVRTLAFSSDSARLVTGGADRTVRLWDVGTGTLERVLTLPDRPGSDTLVSVGFSGDGRSLLTAVAGGSFTLWTVETGAVRLEVETGAALLNGAALSPDGLRVAVSVGDSLAPAVQVRDAANGVLQHTLTGHSNVIAALSFTPDTRTLVTCSWDKTVRFWDVATGAEGRQGVRVGDTDQTLAISADGRRFATGGAAGVQVREMATGELITSLEGHLAAPATARWSPKGKTVVMGDSRGRVSLWDAATGRLIRAFSVPDAGVVSVDYSPDGTTLLLAVRLATGGSHLQLWDASTGLFLRTVASSPAPIWEARFSPDGHRVAAVGARAYVWASDTGQEIAAFSERGLPLNALAWAPDGTWLAAGGQGRLVQAWDLVTGNERPALEGLLGAVDDIAISRNGANLAAAASNDRNVQVWEMTAGTKSRTLDLGLGISTLDFSPDGSLLLAGTGGGEALITALEDGAVLRTFDAHSLGIEVVAFSPDGSRVLTVGGDRVGLVWDVSELMAAAVWRIREVRVDGALVHLGVVGRSGAGVRLAVEATTEVANAASWSEVSDAEVNARDDGSWEVVVPSQSRAAFFRVRTTR